MEFIIGIQPSPVTLTPNSELLELILISERTSKITILGQECDGAEVVSALVFDDGDIDLRVRDSDEQEKEGFPFKNATRNTLELDTPFLDELVMQQTIYSAPDQPHLHWRRITYLMIRHGDKIAQVGNLRDPKKNSGSDVIMPEESIMGPCMITGVGMHNTDIMSLQIIQGAPRSNPLSFSEHLYAYGKSKVGLVNLRPEGGFKKIEKSLFVGMENSDPDVMAVATKLYSFMASWYSSRSSIHRMFPDLYSLIDQSITENDRSVIFSTFRLERHLKYRIQNAQKGHSFDADPFLRIKLYQVVKCLACTLESCQRIIVNKPAMNCYSAAYLAGDLSHLVIALLVLITQIGLTYVLFLSVITDNSETAYFTLKESVIVTPIIAVFSAMLVYKQVSNSFAIRRAYPNIGRHFLGICDFFANGILGVAILIIQVIIVSKQENRVDFVLNSIASIFILELDDSCVFFDDDGTTDLHRRLLMKDFTDRVKIIEDVFFKHSNWRTARNYLQLNVAKCTVEPLPSVHFTESKDVDDKAIESLSPLIIKIGSKDCHEASGGWVAIAQSEAIAKSILQPDSTCHLRFKWRDQGWGNRKGKLRVRLVNVLTGDDVASSPEYGLAPHEVENVEESFDFNHGLVRNCVEGHQYVVEVVIGGGGGHALHLNDFEFRSTGGFVDKSHIVERSSA